MRIIAWAIVWGFVVLCGVSAEASWMTRHCHKLLYTHLSVPLP